MVKLLACGARCSGVRFPAWPLEFSEIGYLLLPSRDMAEIPLKQRKSSIQPTNSIGRFVHSSQEIWNVRILVSVITIIIYLHDLHDYDEAYIQNDEL